MALLKSQTLHEEQTRTKTCKKYGKFATKNDFECFAQKKNSVIKKKKKVISNYQQQPCSWDALLEAT